MRLATVLLVGCGRVAFDPLGDAGASADATALVACGPEVSLVACYPFDDDTLDRSEYGNHAVGAVTYVPGHIGHAALFDDTTDLLVADSASLDFGDGLTVMAWVRLDALPVDLRGVVIDRNHGFILFVRQDGRASVSLSAQVSGSTNASVPVPLGTWTHLAATFDGSTSSLYVDGALVATRSDLVGPLDTVDPAGSRIGGNVSDVTSSAPDVFFGAIDELGVWSEPLTPARISELAQR